MYEIIKKITDIKVILSVTGGFLVSGGLPLEGHIVWFFSNLIWLKHFHDREDKTAVVMYILWQIQAIWGILYWGNFF
ncbi:MAG: hypothetical protein KAI81_04425 [Candidatus Marinimicrobia bacterium]|nr:hypothetical protein [Candidatus Neomarinimicrobiota bacterium]